MTGADRAAARLLATALVVASSLGLFALHVLGSRLDGLTLILTGVAGIVALVALNRPGTRRGGRS